MEDCIHVRTATWKTIHVRTMEDNIHVRTEWKTIHQNGLCEDHMEEGRLYSCEHHMEGYSSV